MIWFEDATITALRVDLYECKTRPALILKEFEPANYVESAWIPQTRGGANMGVL